MLVLFIRPH